MPSTSPFTEEGRTRFRNFQRRLLGYLALSLVLSVAAVVGTIWLITHHRMELLQRLYLKQYMAGLVKSKIRRHSSSSYTLLVRTSSDPKTHQEVTHGCTDEEVEPELDEARSIVSDQHIGIHFRLKPGVPATRFGWRVMRLNDARMSAWMEQNIYGGRGLLGIFYPALVTSFSTFISVAVLLISFDRRKNRQNEAGHLVRGTRALTPKEASPHPNTPTGIGLEMFVQKVRS